MENHHRSKSSESKSDNPAFRNFMCVLGLLTKYDLMNNYYMFTKMYRIVILLTVNVAFLSSFHTAFLKPERHHQTEVSHSSLILRTYFVYCSLNFLYLSVALGLAIITRKQKQVAENVVFRQQIIEEGNALRKSLHVQIKSCHSNENRDVIVLVIGMVFLYATDFYTNEENAIFTSTFGFSFINYYAYTFCTFVDYTKMLALNQIAEEFRLLRSTLKELIVLDSTNFLDMNIRVDKLSAVKSVFRLYGKCVTFSLQINKIYANHSLVSISLSFALIINCLFLGSLYVILKASGVLSNDDFMLFFIKIIIITLIQLVKLMCMIVACTNVRKQADKILQLGREIVIQDLCPQIQSELAFLMNILSQEKVEFTASDFFAIDYSLFISFIGATTTYWVIMLQFQLSHLT